MGNTEQNSDMVDENRPTPETDAEEHIHEGDWCPEGHVPIDVARRLERQRDHVLAAASNFVSVYETTGWSLTSAIDSLKEAIAAVKGGAK